MNHYNYPRQNFQGKSFGKRSRFSNPFSTAPRDWYAAAKGTGGWGRYGPGTASKLTKKYLAAKSASKGSKMKQNLVKQEGSSTSKSTHDYGSNPIRAVGKLGAPQFFVRNDAGANYQAATGAQQGFYFGHFSYGDLLAIKNAAPNTPTITSRVLLEYIEGEIYFANAAVFNTSVTIYDVIARRDLPTVNCADPASCWSTGIFDESAGGTNFATVGAEPFQSELFNQYFKVVGKTKLDVPSGGTHRHVIKWRPNKVLHNEVFANSCYAAGTANQGGIADLTVFTLVIYHGQPAHDSTTITSVTVSPASLDVIHKTSMRYKYLQESSTDWTRSNNLATTFAVGAQIVNDLVGQVQDAAGLKPGTLLS